MFHYSETGVLFIVPNRRSMANAFVASYKPRSVTFLFLPHPHPNPSGCVRVSVTQSLRLIMAEGEQNINDFLTRISTSKQDLNGG